MSADHMALTRHLHSPSHGLATRHRREPDAQELVIMKSVTTLSALAAVLSFAAATDANAWSRNGSVTGPRGTATIQGSGSCSGGTCARGVTRTGPYGYSVSRQDTASCANGTCTGSRTTTGPHGNTIYRQGSVSR
jgi:hypothetical protein